MPTLQHKQPIVGFDWTPAVRIVLHGSKLFVERMLCMLCTSVVYAVASVLVQGCLLDTFVACGFGCLYWGAFSPILNC